MENKKAFPVSTPQGIVDAGADLLDYFACHGPEPKEADIKREVLRDKQRNPHNEPGKPKLRDEIEIRCQLRYKWAHQMMKTRREVGHN